MGMKLTDEITKLPTEDDPILGLTRLFIEEGADKYHRHRYDVGYALVLERLRWTAEKVLEIGVYKGNSLNAWRRYFEDAEITGVDIRPPPKTLHEDVRFVQGDQGDEDFLSYLALDTWDVIVDDGSHQMGHQKRTFERLWPSVRVGGVYICEDLFTSCMVEESPKRVNERTGLTHEDLWNPTREEETALDFFLRQARLRARDRGVRSEGRHTLLTDALFTLSSGSVLITKVHDGEVKAWP